MKDKVLIGAEAIAAYLQISKSTLFRYLKRGMPVVKLPDGRLTTSVWLLKQWSKCRGR